ncbi:hypothetical protein CPB86DRAFT_369319 [Serendipita vermifera]|nr:hypothetical protein CPB86DRAFT_369319 [Serendipita vermifera]
MDQHTCPLAEGSYLILLTTLFLYTFAHVALLPSSSPLPPPSSLLLASYLPFNPPDRPSSPPHTSSSRLVHQFLVLFSLSCSLSPDLQTRD